MKLRRLILSFFLITASYSLAFGQANFTDPKRAGVIKDEITGDIKGLTWYHGEIVKELLKDSEPFEWFLRTRVDEARKIAIRLQKNLALSRTAVVEEKQKPAFPSATRRDILTSLSRLISDLIKDSFFETTGTPDIEQTGRTVRLLDALIEFTDPERLESGKVYPLNIQDLLQAFAKTDPDKSPELLDERALKLVSKRCVDFVDDGTTFWALRMAGAGDMLIKEVETCVTAENRALITNRDAAKPVNDVILGNAMVIDNVFRILYVKKDIANQKRGIEVGREYLRRFEHLEELKELIDWLKERLPKMEAKIRPVDLPLIP